MGIKRMVYVFLVVGLAEVELKGHLTVSTQSSGIHENFQIFRRCSIFMWYVPVFRPSRDDYTHWHEPKACLAPPSSDQDKACRSTAYCSR
jgi:hypothetical protein